MISLVGETRKVIVQGVYELFDKEPSTEWADEQRINRLVFIGERVPQYQCDLIPGQVLSLKLLCTEMLHVIIGWG